MSETQNIYQRLAEINKEVEAVKKTQRNETQKFNFRGIDQIMVEIHNLFAKHEVFITQKVLEKSREERPSKSGGINIWSIVNYEFIFHAPDGTSISTQMVGEAMDSGDKGNNKCVSVALKYALINMFTIPTEEQKENDTDKFSPDVKFDLDKESIEKINSAKDLDELAQIGKDLQEKLGANYRKIIIVHYKKKKNELETKLPEENTNVSAQ